MIVFDEEKSSFKKYHGIEGGILHAFFLEDIYLFAAANLLFIEDALEIKKYS
ncbi:hypothetical protein [Bacillus sp. 2205SS5-2]|uniref:hypothetical protein n=1 Tax=Bacillus sp. 2205SS5-2 TaxID=3109031 RepID=UPI00300745F9